MKNIRVKAVFLAVILPMTCAATLTVASALRQPLLLRHHHLAAQMLQLSPEVFVGGIVAIILVTYLVWRSCIKDKRQQQYGETWVEFQDEPSPQEKEFAARRDVRASTHTMHSIASTVLTRASNIIQIAYIPGVTNRSTPSTPGVLAPPVPPIPIALASPWSRQTYEDQHFFMPGDLRDSTYSGMTDRTGGIAGSKSIRPASTGGIAKTTRRALIEGFSPAPVTTTITGSSACCDTWRTGVDRSPRRRVRRPSGRQ